MGDVDSNLPRRRVGLFYLTGVLAVLISVAGVAGLHWWQKASLRHDREVLTDSAREGKRVRVATATKADELRSVELTGEARPYASVTLYAKISGYLKEIEVDKGDQVQDGQVIAVLESPELTKQYAAALADARNKRLDAERFQFLLKSGSVSQQNADNVETSAKVAEDTAAALKAQKDYEVMTAPFAGIITARYADPGALVQSATSAQTTALPVVTLAQTNRLRIYVYPDQKTASLVRVGDRVEVADSTRPDVRLSAVVSRTSGELDPKTRTLLVEIELDNREQKILAGSFVQVKLFIRTPATVEVPAASLIMHGNKASVGVVGKDNKVNLRDVAIYDSDGSKVRLLSGVSEGERVVLNPGASISEGEKVQPVTD